MKIPAFAKRITRLEKGSKQINIAQVMELLKVINYLTFGVLYKVIGILR